MSDPIRTKPARVLFVEQNEDGSTGGSHRSQFLVVRHLDRASIEPVAAYYERNDFVERMQEVGVPVHVFDEPRLRERRRAERLGRLGSAWAFAEGILWRRAFLRREGIDLVHLNNSVDQGVDTWLPAAKSLGLPVVTDVRGDAHGVTGWWRRRLARRFDRIFPVSDYIRRSIIQGGVNPDLTEVLYLGVDIEDWSKSAQRNPEEVRAELRVEEEQLLAVMVGNIRTWKGQHVVAQAFAAMEALHRSRWRIVFAGKIRPEDEDYRKEVQATFDSAGMGAQVDFLGFRSDVPDLLCASDVALHASTTPEPGGRAVLEALLSGTVVVAADRGGHTEYFQEPPKVGFLFSVEDPAGLARILMRLGEDPELRAGVATQAKTRAQDFTIQRTVRQLECIYRQLLGRPPGI